MSSPACRVCDSRDLEPAIDLGLQPWCNHFIRPEEAGREPFYPLNVVHCSRCTTAQLDFTVKKEVLFADHTYPAETSKVLSNHFARVAYEVDASFMKDRSEKWVLDIGSNDGTQLKQYKALGFSVLGVESAKSTAAIANEDGIETLQAFFNREVGLSLQRRFDVINAAGVFFHLEELHSVTDGIRECLKNDGIFVVQFLYMKRILETLAFDQICHEHLLYYNLETIQTLLSRHGLAMFDCYLSPIHGGSIIGFVTHAGKRSASGRLELLLADERASGCNDLVTYRRFARDIVKKKAENLELLTKSRSQGKRIYGFGAPFKGNTLLNYFGIGPELVECLVEKNSLHRGMVSPGMHIPIAVEEEIEHPPDMYYVLAWNSRNQILNDNRSLIDSGVTFFFPVEPKVQ